MVRSRIGLEPAFANTDTHPGTDRWRGSVRPAPETHLERCAVEPPAERPAGAFAFVLEVVAPWFGRTARSVGLGCLLAMGCGSGEPIALEGSVRDGRGEPVPGAQLTTEDGRTLATDDQGRFSLSAREGERVIAHPCTPAHGDSEMRIEVRAPCDGWSPVRWQQLYGPTLDPEQMWMEEDGRVLVVRSASAGASWAGSSRAEHAGVFEDAPLEALTREDGGCEAERPQVGLSPQVQEWHRSPMSARMDCASCHRDDGRLVVEDAIASVSGAPVEHLGSGAVCASCHRRVPGQTADASPGMPQADVLLGRGARLIDPLEGGAHRFIVDTCVRCHMTRPELDDPRWGRVGGHTFAVRAEGDAVHPAACAPCHGRGEPERIGIRDWDGDGRAGAFAAEHGAAWARAREGLRARIEALGVADGCLPARRASDVRAHEGRLALVDRAGRWLGDCDESGSWGADETPVTTHALPGRLADVAHDLALLRSDGSAGLHNPAYVTRVLGAALLALQ